MKTTLPPVIASSAVDVQRLKKHRPCRFLRNSPRNAKRLAAWPVVALLVALGCKSESRPAPVATPETASPQPEVLATNVIEAETFSLRWQPSADPSEPGAPAGQLSGQLVLQPKAPFKNNLEYPYRLKFEGGGARPSKTELTKADMEVNEARVVVPVTYVDASDAR